MSLSPQLLEYVLKARASGLSDEAIREELIKIGWGPDDVKAAVPPIQVPVADLPVVQFHAPQNSPHKGLLIGLVLAVLLFGGVSFAYFKKIGPFGSPPYTEKNLLFGILDKSSEIHTSTYLLSSEFNLGPRDSDAEPFVSSVAKEPDLAIKYGNDFRRAQDVTGILSALLNSKSFPSSLQKLQANLKAGLIQNTYESSIRIDDPVSGKPYAYTLTDDGRNFGITVVFESENAVKTIKSGYGFSPTNTFVTGKAVTFTKESYSYIYLPSELPKSPIEELGEMVQYLPPEIRVGGSVGGTTDLRKDGSEWKFLLEGSGDFGDLSYAVNVEALKKNALYYFRINKIPSLFFSQIGDIKGKWISVDPYAHASILGDEFGFAPDAFPEIEREYRKNKDEMLRLLRETAELADEEKLFIFNGAPQKGKREGRTVYSYDLKINKAALIPFYKKFIGNLPSNPLLPRHEDVDDELISYLESPEFSETLDYYDKNMRLLVSVDTEGYIAEIAYSLRIIPADAAVALKNKQGNFTLTLSVKDINEPVEIEAPEDAEPIEKIVKELEAGTPGVIGELGDARMRARDARRVSSIQQLQLALEIYHDTYASYPSTLTALVPSLIPEMPQDPAPTGGYEYEYNPYFSANWLTGDSVAKQCTDGKPCNGFHLGISLEQSDTDLLSSDADRSATGVGATISGSDSSRCNGRQTGGNYCYDLVNQ